jgi:uncharacterized BrkB/YihY/UPF0761 family membrane protein
MILHISKNRRRAGWGLFELLCFIAACVLTMPLAQWVSHHFPSHSRAVFFIVMLTVYPVLGFIFCILMHLIFRWEYNRRHKVGAKHED